MLSLIHVNRQHLAMNAKDGGKRPVYTIKQNGRTRYAQQVHIKGDSWCVYDGTQLKCGARAWIETRAEIKLIGETTFAEARAVA